MSHPTHPNDSPSIKSSPAGYQGRDRQPIKNKSGNPSEAEPQNVADPEQVHKESTEAQRLQHQTAPDQPDQLSPQTSNTELQFRGTEKQKRQPTAEVSDKKRKHNH